MLIVEGHNIQNYSDQMTNDELYEFCVLNKELRIERDRHQNIIIMAPVGGESGFFEKEFIVDISIWVRNNHSGYAFSSSTGFMMPNGAMRSPDASWVSEDRWKVLNKDQKKKFLPLVPDFVVEVRSPSDKLATLKEKMQEWVENGVRLGWLIDPEDQQAFIYRADGSIDIIKGFEHKLSGEEVLKDFEFKLSQLRMP